MAAKFALIKLLIVFNSKLFKSFKRALEKGGRAVYDNSPQSFIIIFFYSLAQQLLLNFDYIVY